MTSLDQKSFYPCPLLYSKSLHLVICLLNMDGEYNKGCKYSNNSTKFKCTSASDTFIAPQRYWSAGKWQNGRCSNNCDQYCMCILHWTYCKIFRLWAKSRYYKERNVQSKKRQAIRRWFVSIRHGRHVLSQCPKQRHSPPGNIKKCLIIPGGNASL